MGSAPAVWCQEQDDYIQRRIHLCLARNWSHKRIAAGENGPQLNLEESRRQTLLVLLHEGIPPSAIAQHEHWSEPQLRAAVQELVQAGFLRETRPNVFLPTVLVMSVGEVARSMPVDPLLVERAADLFRARLPEIQQLYGRLESTTDVPFESASLFLLSNVMLDNWQIRNVESRVLQAERPMRQGGRFYYSIQEDLADGREAFSIYGNHVRNYGNRVVTSDLVNLLLKHRPELEKLYRASPYFEEVSFEEYFLWWYHLFYSAVTDHLHRSGAIKIPASGITTYLVLTEEAKL